MLEYQGDLLLSLSTEYPQRLPHLPVASQRSSECQGVTTTACHPDLYVLSWCYVSLETILSYAITDGVTEYVERESRAFTTLMSTCNHTMRSVGQLDTIESYLAQANSSRARR